MIEKDKVPNGNSAEDTKARMQIIFEFYNKWKERNPQQRVYNNALKDFINIRAVSIEETARHASKRYLSTLAVLQLDAILACSKLVRIGKTEHRKNQQQFKAMLIMQHNCPGLGAVKLTVGVRHKTLLKVQYCITALDITEEV